MVRKVRAKRRSNTWFYGIGFIGIFVAYFVVQWSMLFLSNCNGSAVWDWEKMPPGFVCSTDLPYGR